MPEKSRIKVIGNDGMYFWADAVTLDPLGNATYDPWAHSDPEPVPSMSQSEWNARRSVLSRVSGEH